MRRISICFGLLFFILFPVSEIWADTCTGFFDWSQPNNWYCVRDASLKYSCQKCSASVGGPCIYNSTKTLCGNNVDSGHCCTSCLAAADGSSCQEFGCTNAFLSGYGCTFCNTVNGNCNSEAYPNGVCTYANITKKCDAGTLSTIDSAGTDGYFNWKCLGNSCSDSKDANNCVVKRIAPEAGADGVCNSTAISTSYCDYDDISSKCATGTPTLVKDNFTDGIKWTCSGTTTGEVCSGGVGDTVSCSTTKKSPITRIDGVCSVALNNTVVQIKPTSDLCDVGTPTTVTTSDTTYSWKCNGTDGACPANAAVDPSCSATQDTVPTLTTTELKTTGGTVIAAETSSTGTKRNHSCDIAFGGSDTSLWTITAADAQGVDDIDEITLWLDSTGLDYYFGPVPAVNGKASFSVGITDPGTYLVKVLIKDKHDPPTAVWVSTGRYFKIWDCEVDVSGTFYDSSANPSFVCNVGNTVGFSTTIPQNIPFDLVYISTLENIPRNMANDSPDFDGKMDWRYNYNIQTLDNYPGVINSRKIGDSNPACTSSWTSAIEVNKYVNPYSSNPAISLKYSAVMDQSAWYRVSGGSVLADVEAKNYVPITCATYCKTSVGGLVWSKNVNLSDHDGSLRSEVQKQPPKKEVYTTLKYDYYTVKEIGTTFGGTTINWPTDIGNTRGVIFVDGDLNINGDVEPTGNDYVFFIVKGKITIAPSVTQVNGMFYSDTTIEASGENETPLTISGSLYGRGGITLDRSYVTKRTNNTVPAVLITYDPNLIFKLPKGMWETYDNYTIE